MPDRPKQVKPHDCHCGKAGKDLIVHKQWYGFEVTWVITCVGCGAYLSLPSPKFTRNEAVRMWNHLQEKMKEQEDGET